MTNFQPDWASPPGHTIRDVARERDLTISELAKKLQVSVPFLERLLEGKEEINEQLAMWLSVILGASPIFWMERERQYRQDLRRLQDANQTNSSPV